MPAVVKKVKGGFKAYTHAGKAGKPLAKKAMTKDRALAQQRAVNASLRRQGKL